jgi:presqualene diphosphate synthase
MTSTAMSSPEVEAVRRKASGSSFYSAMRLMPKAEREAMFAIYAFCRAVDDVADDGVGSREERLVELEDWRGDLRSLCTGGRPGRAAFLEDVIARYHPRLEDFFAVIDGMQMDVDGDIVAPTLDVLDLYCDRVASAVGRLSIKVFGMDDDAGFALAHYLGRALQLTNILRDLDEDAAAGRLYLPREYLDASIGPVDPYNVLSHRAVDQACHRLAQLAHGHYDEADRIIAARPKGDLRAPKLMGVVYREILKRMESVGWAPPRRRVRLPKMHLAFLALRHGLAPWPR